MKKKPPMTKDERIAQLVSNYNALYEDYIALEDQLRLLKASAGREVEKTTPVRTTFGSACGQ